jgi:hypothetical protein
MEQKKQHQYSFKAPEELIEQVCTIIDNENRKIKNRKARKTLSSKIKDLLYDYISR